MDFEYTRRVFLLLTIVYVCGAVYVPNCNPKVCTLPDCYCSFYDIPGDGVLTPADTPQMVLFTYTGALNSKVRDAIMDIFPDKRTNRNKCAIGITLFLVSQGSDDCGVYRMSWRGHEIALAGRNRTGWLDVDWTKQITEQHANVAEKSFIDSEEIVGMRAQKLKPDGDKMLKVAQADGLLYDSSYLAGPRDGLDDSQLYLWPFTLDKTPFHGNGIAKENSYGLQCKNPDCPKEPYKGIWEIPVSSLIGTRSGAVRQCTYLDDCITDLQTGRQVYELLRRHFMFSYTRNRAPFQVNLSPKSLEIKIISEGLKLFVDFLQTKQDTWIITNQEALRWIQKPVPLSNIMDSGVWDCPEKSSSFVDCQLQDAKNSTINTVTFRDIMNVDNLWIIQTVLLVIIYFVVYRFDRYKHAKDK